MERKEKIRNKNSTVNKLSFIVAAFGDSLELNLYIEIEIKGEI